MFTVCCDETGVIWRSFNLHRLSSIISTVQVSMAELDSVLMLLLADYHFTTREAMQEGIDNGEYIENAEFSGNLYGTRLVFAPLHECCSPHNQEQP